MPMVPFYLYCMESAKRETRVLGVPRRTNGLGAGRYVLTELYCDELECDCRRVILLVHPAEDMNNTLATLNYGWESEAFYAPWSHDEKLAREMAGLSLELFGRQSAKAEIILELVQQTAMEDPDYVARLKRHYLQFKEALRAAAIPGPRLGMGRKRRLL